MAYKTRDGSLELDEVLAQAPATVQDIQLYVEAHNLDFTATCEKVFDAKWAAYAAGEPTPLVHEILGLAYIDEWD